MKDKVIITCALVGSLTTRKQTPHLPVTPEEIARSGLEAAEAGATVIHIHARKDDGTPTVDFDRFKKIVGTIRARSDVVINLTTTSTADSEDETRFKPFIELKPEIATFDCGTMNQPVFSFENSPLFLEKSLVMMGQAGVKPEIECFDTAMLYNALKLHKRGLIKSPFLLSCVLGVPGGLGATVTNLEHMVSLLPRGAVWTGFGVGGKNSVPMIYASLAMGGNIRVGLEDNIYMGKGVLARSNAEQVERAVRIVHNFGKKAATPGEARKLLRLA